MPSFAIRRRDRLAAAVLTLAVAGACWAWLGKMLWDMSVMPMDGMAMPAPDPGYALWLVVMWTVMMAAMMLPSALPATLAFAGFSRGETESPARTPAFVLGYVLAWTAFSVAAAALQWGLERGALMSPATMALRGEALAGAVLIAAGIYQWTPLKRACLGKCRSPIGFLMTEWRDGLSGALVMGIRHGLYCVGCCWALMALLLAAGVMNALWIVGLTVFVIVEKISPLGEPISRVAGVVLVVAGLWLMV